MDVVFPNSGWSMPVGSVPVRRRIGEAVLRGGGDRPVVAVYDGDAVALMVEDGMRVQRTVWLSWMLEVVWPSYVARTEVPAAWLVVQRGEAAGNVRLGDLRVIAGMVLFACASAALAGFVGYGIGTGLADRFGKGQYLDAPLETTVLVAVGLGVLELGLVWRLWWWGIRLWRATGEVAVLFGALGRLRAAMKEG